MISIKTNKFGLSKITEIFNNEFFFRSQIIFWLVIFVAIFFVPIYFFTADVGPSFFFSVLFGAIVSYFVTSIREKLHSSQRTKINFKKAVVVLFIVILFSYGLAGSLCNICNLPVAFHVGEIDSRFGLSEEDFSGIIKDASERWDTASRKKLFVYNQTTGIKVNLVYDKRQEKVERLKKIKIDAENYEADLKQYENDVLKYETDVNTWNSSGGTSQKEYWRLKSLEGELDRTREGLEKRAKELKKEAGSLSLGAILDNFKLNNLERLTDKAIIRLAQGLYIEDKNTGEKEINIYAFEDKKDLMSVLMHEMGHSIGIEDKDASGSNSIMFFKNSESRQKLENPWPTGEDIEIVNKYCGEFSFIDRMLESTTIYSK